MCEAVGNGRFESAAALAFFEISGDLQFVDCRS